MKKNYFFVVVLLIATLPKLNAQLTEVATGLDEPSSIVINGTDLYFTNYSDNAASAGTVNMIDLNDPQPIATSTVLVSNITGPWGMLLRGNELFIALYGGNKIIKIDISDPDPGSTQADVITGLSGPDGLALIGDELYIAEYDGNRISKIDLSAPTPSSTLTTVSTSIGGPTAMSLYGTDLYISEYGVNRISKLDLTASLPITKSVVITGLSEPDGMYINPPLLYFSNGQPTNEIMTIDLNDATPTATTLVTGFNDPTGLFFDNGYLYIADRLGDKILKYTDAVLDIKDIELISDLVYPNPSSDYINIKNLNTANRYTIYNSLGKMVNFGELQLNDKINIQSLKTGIYYFSLDDGRVSKFIKK